MGLWDYCAICGRRIEVGESCYGIKNENADLESSSICKDCIEPENFSDEERSG